MSDGVEAAEDELAPVLMDAELLARLRHRRRPMRALPEDDLGPVCVRCGRHRTSNIRPEPRLLIEDDLGRRLIHWAGACRCGDELAAYGLRPPAQVS